MNWITTNIRLPEDLYMELKMEAARTRKSVAAIIREKITFKKADSTDSKKKEDVVKFMKKVKKLAIQVSKETKGENLTQALIDMRYEQ